MINVGIISIINAVYATAQALDLVLKDTCGTDYDGICDGFPQSATEVRSLVLGKMAEVSFTDVTGNPFLFKMEPSTKDILSTDLMIQILIPRSSG